LLHDSDPGESVGKAETLFTARVLVGSSAQNPHLLYRTQFYTLSPLIYVEDTATGASSLFVPPMEYERARHQARVDRVQELHNRGAPFRVSAFLIQLFQERQYTHVLIPSDFPILLADRLRDAGIGLTIDDRTFYKERAVKTGDEIEKIGKIAQAAQRAIEIARQTLILARSKGQVLLHEDQALTTGNLARQIERALLEEECYVCSLLVSTGTDTANPHGDADQEILLGEPVVVDVVPVHKRWHYHADVCRTFVRGEPSPAIRKMYQAVSAAREKTLSTIQAGVSSQTVHQQICAFLEQLGYSTSQSQGAEAGLFHHALGHGIGLSPHEYPPLAALEIPLKAGNVLCIEPALYAPQIGGVRVEDMIVVTETGYVPMTTPPEPWIL
jgi:Xaa-Pro aminopeptidase